jgi:hypothetical protein
MPMSALAELLSNSFPSRRSSNRQDFLKQGHSKTNLKNNNTIFDQKTKKYKKIPNVRTALNKKIQIQENITS